MGNFRTDVRPNRGHVHLEEFEASGKTDAMAHFVNEHCNSPPCMPGYPGGHRPAIIAPTLGDAIEACVNGPSGLKAHNPMIRSVQTTGGTYLRWPSGVEGKLFGAYSGEDVERLRAGGNRCVVWAEELATWSRLEDCWDHMTFGLRLGPHPRVVASTTPKPRAKLKELMADPRTILTRAHTDDNPHLEAAVRGALYGRYGGTRLGRQELAAELLEDVPGALWKRTQLDELRVARQF
jgi:phage terminase large subunit-like protein